MRVEFHANTIEGYFSTFKGMKGDYLHCSERHLQCQLADFDCRTRSSWARAARRTGSDRCVRQQFKLSRALVSPVLGLDERVPISEFQSMPTPDEYELAEDVERYLIADKVVRGACIWKRKQHADYREVVKILECPSMPEFNGSLIMTAHLTRVPQKFSFVLSLGNVRAFGLDVNPGSAHYNPRTLVSVSSTHWQRFPLYDAVPDERNLSHFEWLKEFCARARIGMDYLSYKTPPHEPPQLVLL